MASFTVVAFADSDIQLKNLLFEPTVRFNSVGVNNNGLLVQVTPMNTEVNLDCTKIEEHNSQGSLEEQIEKLKASKFQPVVDGQ